MSRIIDIHAHVFPDDVAAADGGWRVRVRWRLRRSSHSNLMIWDVCLNFLRGSRTKTRDLSKSDFEAMGLIPSESP